MEKNLLDKLKGIAGVEPDMTGSNRAFTDTLYKAHMKIWFGDFYDYVESLDEKARAYLLSAYMLKKVNTSGKPRAMRMVVDDYGWINVDSKTTDGRKFKAYRYADKVKEDFSTLNDVLDFILAEKEQ